MDNKNKKSVLKYILISVFIVLVFVLFLFKGGSIKNTISSLFISSNNKLTASVNYVCPSGSYGPYGNICYYCRTGSFNSYDKQCYEDAYYNKTACPSGSEYYNGNCISKTFNNVSTPNACSNGVIKGMNGTSYKCYKIVQKAGGYDCVSGISVSSIKRSDTYWQSGHFCKIESDSHIASTGRTVTVVFNADGGLVEGKSTTIKTCDIISGDTSENTCNIHVPDAATKQGYEFYKWSGWPTSNEMYSANEIATFFESSEIREYKAVYNYYVTFDPNGGKLYNTATNVALDNNKLLCTTNVDLYCDVLLDYDLRREGYKFLGWFTEQENGVQIHDPINLKASTTLYAHWSTEEETVEFTATFNSNGGSEPNPKTITKKLGVAIGELPETTKNGYTFAGWFTKSSGGTQISSSTIMPFSNVTYYAHWTKNESSQTTYTATFNPNGGSTPSPKTITKTAGSTLGDLPTTTKSDSTFIGWFTEASGGTQISSSTTMPSSNVTYYAHWSSGTNQYTITYKYTYGNGNYASSEDYINMDCTPVKLVSSYYNTVWSDTATYGSSYTIQPHWWTCEGYIFTNWNERVDGTGTWWEAGATIDEWNNYNRDVVLYAQWEPIIYKINYHGNGGLYNEEDTWLDPREFKYDAVYPGANSDVPMIWSNDNFFVRNGYTFTGWKTKAGYSGWESNYSGGVPKTWRWGDGYKEEEVSIGVGDEVEHQVDLYAQWTPNTYGINYDGNGSTSGETTNSSHTYDTLKKLTKNGYTKDGYKFIGWNTKNDGTGTSYTDEEEVLNLAQEGEITLYAQWQENGTNTAVIPTTSKCKNLTYTGSSQILVNEAGEGYTWTGGIERTEAGSQKVTATLSDGYKWSDGTTETKQISCSIGKGTPTITLSETTGTVEIGKTVEFNEKASVKGTFTVTSGNTSIATVTQASSSEINANTNNKVTVTGVKEGSSTITVNFTPTDTNNYNNASSKTYTVTISNSSTDINELDIRNNKDVVFNKVITLSSLKTTLNDNNIILKDKNGNIKTNEKLGTNDKIIIGDKTYEVAIMGDVTGDGETQFNDVIKTYRFYRKKLVPNEVELIASDLVVDNNIKFNDVIKIYRMYRRSGD